MSVAKRLLSATDREEIVRRYQAGESSPKLREAFGLSHNGAVTRILKSRGVEIRPNGTHQRRHTVNHDYFARIQSPIQSYLVGLIAADGCVRRVKGTGAVTLTCHEDDEELVELLRREIGGVVYNPKKGRHKTWWVWSQPLSAQLIDLGITPRKSLTLNIHWGKIPEDLFRYFILGVLDGDGCILDRPGHYRVQIVTASKTFAEDLQTLIPGTRTFVAIPKNPRHSPLYRINVSGRDRLLVVLNWLYADLPFSSLGRKSAIARRIIAWAKDSQKIDQERKELSLGLADAYKNGTTGTDLAQQHNLSPVTVYKMVRRVGGHIKPSSRAIQARLSAVPLEDRYNSERVKDIASDLGVTKATVYNHLRRAGAQTGPTCVDQLRRVDVTDDEIIRLHAEGLSTHQIGQRVSMNPASISYRCRRLGLLLRGNFVSNSAVGKKERIVSLYLEGNPVRVISHLLNLTPVTVYKYLDLAGVDRPRR